MKAGGAILLAVLAGLLSSCTFGLSIWWGAGELVSNVPPELVGLPEAARVNEPVSGTARIGMPDSCWRFRELSITYLPGLSPMEVRVTAYIARPINLVCLPVFWIHEETFTLVFGREGLWHVKAGYGSPFVTTQTRAVLVSP